MTVFLSCARGERRRRTTEQLRGRHGVRAQVLEKMKGRGGRRFLGFVSDSFRETCTSCPRTCGGLTCSSARSLLSLPLVLFSLLLLGLPVCISRTDALTLSPACSSLPSSRGPSSSTTATLPRCGAPPTPVRGPPSGRTFCLSSSLSPPFSSHSILSPSSPSSSASSSPSSSASSSPSPLPSLPGRGFTLHLANPPRVRCVSPGTPLPPPHASHPNIFFTLRKRPVRSPPSFSRFYASIPVLTSSLLPLKSPSSPLRRLLSTPSSSAAHPHHLPPFSLEPSIFFSFSSSLRREPPARLSCVLPSSHTKHPLHHTTSRTSSSASSSSSSSPPPYSSSTAHSSSLSSFTLRYTRPPPSSSPILATTILPQSRTASSAPLGTSSLSPSSSSSSSSHPRSHASSPPSSSPLESSPTSCVSTSASFLSREWPVYGREHAARVSKARVLVVGLGGVGVEAAKCLLLAGVGNVALLDDEDPNYLEEGSANFAIPAGSTSFLEGEEDEEEEDGGELKGAEEGDFLEIQERQGEVQSEGEKDEDEEEKKRCQEDSRRGRRFPKSQGRGGEQEEEEREKRRDAIGGEMTRTLLGEHAPDVQRKERERARDQEDDGGAERCNATGGGRESEESMLSLQTRGDSRGENDVFIGEKKEACARKPIPSRRRRRRLTRGELAYHSLLRTCMPHTRLEILSGEGGRTQTDEKSGAEEGDKEAAEKVVEVGSQGEVERQREEAKEDVAGEVGRGNSHHPRRPLEAHESVRSGGIAERRHSLLSDSPGPARQRRSREDTAAVDCKGSRANRPSRGRRTGRTVSIRGRAFSESELEKLLSRFDVVLLCDCPIEDAIHLNELCRRKAKRQDEGVCATSENRRRRVDSLQGAHTQEQTERCEMRLGSSGHTGEEGDEEGEEEEKEQTREPSLFKPRGEERRHGQIDHETTEERRRRNAGECKGGYPQRSSISRPYKDRTSEGSHSGGTKRHTRHPRLIAVWTTGLAGRLFVDLGETYTFTCPNDDHMDKPLPARVSFLSPSPFPPPSVEEERRQKKREREEPPKERKDNAIVSERRNEEELRKDSPLMEKRETREGIASQDVSQRGGLMEDASSSPCVLHFKSLKEVLLRLTGEAWRRGLPNSLGSGEKASMKTLVEEEQEGGEEAIHKRMLHVCFLALDVIKQKRRACLSRPRSSTSSPLPFFSSSISSSSYPSQESPFSCEERELNEEAQDMAAIAVDLWRRSSLENPPSHLPSSSSRESVGAFPLSPSCCGDVLSLLLDADDRVRKNASGGITRYSYPQKRKEESLWETDGIQEQERQNTKSGKRNTRRSPESIDGLGRKRNQEESRGEEESFLDLEKEKKERVSFHRPPSSVSGEANYDQRTEEEKQDGSSARLFLGRDEREKEVWNLAQRLHKSTEGQLAPVSSIMGGLAAQEALKAISGRFTPVHQFMYFDALDLLTPRKRQSFLNKENKQGRTDPSRSRLSTEAGDYSLPPTTARLSAGMRRTRRRRRGEKEKKSFLQLPRWYSQEKLLGPEVQKRLNALNVFLVGAGAVGCEILKNFALMGVSSCRRSSLPTRRRRVGEGEKKEERKKKETGEGEQERENFFSSFLPTPCTENEVEESRHGGDLTLADADIVERSNLNRQFLFSQGDVNRYKADAAASSIRRINPCMRVHPVRAFVKRESEDQFDFPFWKRQSLVVMALDTIAARMYLDSQCLLYQKPLIEAGTLGLRGHAQALVPHLTESYGSTADPRGDDDEDAPQPTCSVRGFPTAPVHLVQWGLLLFSRLFEQRPLKASELMTRDFIRVAKKGSLLGEDQRGREEGEEERQREDEEQAEGYDGKIESSPLSRKRMAEEPKRSEERGPHEKESHEKHDQKERSRELGPGDRTSSSASTDSPSSSFSSECTMRKPRRPSFFGRIKCLLGGKKISFYPILDRLLSFRPSSLSLRAAYPAYPFFPPVMLSPPRDKAGRARASSSPGSLAHEEAQQHEVKEKKQTGERRGKTRQSTEEGGERNYCRSETSSFGYKEIIRLPSVNRILREEGFSVLKDILLSAVDRVFLFSCVESIKQKLSEGRGGGAELKGEEKQRSNGGADARREGTEEQGGEEEEEEGGGGGRGVGAERDEREARSLDMRAEVEEQLERLRLFLFDRALGLFHEVFVEDITTLRRSTTAETEERTERDSAEGKGAYESSLSSVSTRKKDGRRRISSAETDKGFADSTIDRGPSADIRKTRGELSSEGNSLGQANAMRTTKTDEDVDTTTALRPTEGGKNDQAQMAKNTLPRPLILSEADEEMTAFLTLASKLLAKVYGLPEWIWEGKILPSSGKDKKATRLEEKEKKKVDSRHYGHDDANEKGERSGQLGDGDDQLFPQTAARELLRSVQTAREASSLSEAARRAYEDPLSSLSWILPPRSQTEPRGDGGSEADQSRDMRGVLELLKPRWRRRAPTMLDDPREKSRLREDEERKRKVEQEKEEGEKQVLDLLAHLLSLAWLDLESKHDTTKTTSSSPSFSKKIFLGSSPFPPSTSPSSSSSFCASFPSSLLLAQSFSTSSISSYDKDNPLHLEFLTAASRLRGRCFDFENPPDLLSVQQLSGRIVPATATATTVAAALAALEVFRLIQTNILREEEESDEERRGEERSRGRRERRRRRKETDSLERLGKKLGKRTMTMSCGETENEKERGAGHTNAGRSSGLQVEGQNRYNEKLEEFSLVGSPVCPPPRDLKEPQLPGGEDVSDGFERASCQDKEKKGKQNEAGMVQETEEKARGEGGRGGVEGTPSSAYVSPARSRPCLVMESDLEDEGWTQKDRRRGEFLFFGVVKQTKRSWQNRLPLTSARRDRLRARLRSSFFNLSAPFLTHAAPLPPPTAVIPGGLLQGQVFSPWDFLRLCLVDKTKRVKRRREGSRSAMRGATKETDGDQVDVERAGRGLALGKGGGEEEGGGEGVMWKKRLEQVDCLKDFSEEEHKKEEKMAGTRMRGEEWRAGEEEAAGDLALRSVTVEGLVDLIREALGVEVLSLTCEDSVLYAREEEVQALYDSQGKALSLAEGPVPWEGRVDSDLGKDGAYVATELHEERPSSSSSLGPGQHSPTFASSTLAALPRLSPETLPSLSSSNDSRPSSSSSDSSTRAPMVSTGQTPSSAPWTAFSLSSSAPLPSKLPAGTASDWTQTRQEQQREKAESERERTRPFLDELLRDVYQRNLSGEKQEESPDTQQEGRGEGERDGGRRAPAGVRESAGGSRRRSRLKWLVIDILAADADGNEVVVPQLKVSIAV